MSWANRVRLFLPRLRIDIDRVYFMAPGTSYSEVIFIGAMMVLILVICVVAVGAFFKTYKKEMREKAVREAAKKANRAE
jgi:hypothetical protein